MRLEIHQALLRFIYARNVPRGHPPQRRVHTGKFFKPRMPLAQQLDGTVLYTK